MMADDIGRKPDYRLKAMHKKTEQKATIGAAWLNEDGSISIVLDYLVQIPNDQSLAITLFPITEVQPNGSHAKRGAKPKLVA